MTSQSFAVVSSRRGVALLVTLIFLAIFTCMAVAVAISADTNMVMARNRLEAQQAASLAETGLFLIQRHLGGLAVPATDNASDLHKAIAEDLESDLYGSNMLDVTDIHYDSTRVLLPAITLARPDGRSGTVSIAILASGGASDNTTVTIDSTGCFGRANRRVRYNMTVQRGRSVLLDYGIASKSPIQLTGNASVVGLNNPSEGSIMSATYSTDRAIRMVGTVAASGDVAIVNPSGQIFKQGTVTIGGQELVGVSEPEWPEIDSSVFLPYVQNTYSGNGSGNLVLSNVRIPPNTNPTFSDNVLILGVMHVASPNKVTFSGNTSIVGVIVSDEPAVDNLKTNSIKFTGNVTTSGVENLPPLAQYDGLRDLVGSFLLAPGFSVEFTGNFNTVNGCMVASEFKFTGNAGGRIKGGVVNLRDSSFQVAGNAPIIIDREGASENPAGITSSYRLVCVSGSYYE